ncbi:MAG: hypothetical protein R3C09_16180 [Pirellulaceae bacterium]
MNVFIRRYVSTLLGLLIVMGGYSLFVVPAIEPPARPPVTPPPFSGALAGDQWWRSFFPAGAWQTSNPQILQSKRGIVLLSQSWVQEGPKTLRLQPLTMILPQGDSLESSDAAKDVLIVSSELGAVIHLEEEFDPSVSTPSVERGQLSGAIEITRQLQGKPNEYPLKLRTSDLSLDRSRVFTQQEVIIEWPEGIIVGHDMKLTLQGDLLGAHNKQESSPWGPLRTLELYHVDRIEAALPAGGLWKDSKLPSPAGQPPLSTLPALMKLACGGRFTFDFTQSRATLTGGVQLTHQLAQLPPDEFSSQEVTLQVVPPDGSHSNPLHTARASDSRGTLGGIQIRQIEARGVDSLENFVGERKVELKAPTIDAFASAKRLRIDVLKNRIELDGKLDHPSATQSTAWLKYGGYEFTAPRIDYDSDGNAANPALAAEHLGYLVASGAGELRMPSTASTGKALVRWQDTLEMRPTDIAGQQWVGLFGNVLVESALHGYMASDKLEIWLRKNQAASAASNAPAPGGTLSNTSVATAQFLPERIHATGKTTLDAQQIKAHVEELSLALNFVQDVDPNAAAPGSPALSDSAGRPMYQWLNPPAENVSAGGAISPVPPIAQAAQGTQKKFNPLTVNGSSLHSTIIVAGQESWVDNLTVAGPLNVTGEAIGPNQPGWNVVGDELQLATNSAGQVDMQISGKPARITLGEGSLEGPLIRFDQRSNLIWMDQPGEFTIPTSALAASQPSSTGTIDWFEPPHCTWKGRMLFDGRIVRIEGDIDFDGAMAIDHDQFWWIHGKSDVLQLELSEAVNLDDLKGATAQPLKVTVSQNVNIMASQLDHTGTKKSRQQLQLPSLSFDIQTHEILGLGPGSIRSWYIAKSTIGQMASSSASRATENLQGAHLIFRESMSGFLDRSELNFLGKVEVAAGPLANWEESIDLAQMQRLTINQMHLDCDLLKLYDTSGLSSTASLASGRGSGGDRTSKAWEIQAKGNVHFAGKAESGDYEGEGAEVTYVQAKELLTLFGEPRRSARIIKTPTDRSLEQTINASVEYAAINPRTLAIESFKIGQDGIRVDAPIAPGGVAPPGGNLPIPNPRGSVSDFLQRR